MENKLKNLFDFQKFEKNAILDKLISETRAKYGNALSDDDLLIVAAAGNPYEMTENINRY